MRASPSSFPLKTTGWGILKKKRATATWLKEQSRSSFNRATGFEGGAQVLQLSAVIPGADSKRRSTSGDLAVQKKQKTG